jgi:hypothetical protein
MLVLNYIQWCGESGWWGTVGWTHQLVQVQDSLLVREGEGGRGPYRGRILGRNWDKSLLAIHSYLVTSTNSYCPPPRTPPPSSKSGLKLVCNVNIVQYMETSCLIFLKLMPRNLNEIVRSWIRLQKRTYWYPICIFMEQLMAEWEIRKRS